MKKHLKKIFVFVVATSIFVFGAGLVSAQGLVTCGKGDIPCNFSDLIPMFSTIVQFLVYEVGLPLFGILLVVSGLQMVLAQSSSSFSAAKGRLWTAVTGLFFMLAASAIVTLIITALGKKP